MGQTGIWLTPRRVIEEAGGWDESLTINQDGEYFSRVLFHSKSIKYCENIVVHYRSGNPKSISQYYKNSYSKAKSLLDSYILYKKHAIENNHLTVLKEGLGTNFLMFIYQYYGLYPDLSEKAEQEFKELGYAQMWSVGGSNFMKLSKLIGFKTALRLREKIKFGSFAHSNDNNNK